MMRGNGLKLELFLFNTISALSGLLVDICGPYAQANEILPQYRRNLLAGHCVILTPEIAAAIRDQARDLRGAVAPHGTEPPIGSRAPEQVVVPSSSTPLRLPPEVESVSQDMRTVRMRSGVVLDSAEKVPQSELQFISFDLPLQPPQQGLRRTPARVLSFSRDGDVLTARVELPTTPSTFRNLTEAELSSARPSLTARDTFAARSPEAALGHVAVLDPGRPAGGLDMAAVEQMAQRNGAGRFVEAERFNARARAELGTFEHEGARFAPAVDSQGRSVRTSALESNNKRRGLLQSGVSSDALNGISQVEVYQIVQLPRAGNASPMTEALRHPQMQGYLDYLRSRHIRLDIDPALRLVNSGAEYSPSQRILRMPANTTWHVFQHEFQHMLLNENGFRQIYSRLLEGFGQGRPIEQILTPQESSHLNGWRTSGFQVDSLIDSARRGLPINGADETAAVEAELRSFSAQARIPGQTPQQMATLRQEWIHSRRYALRWQVYELEALAARTPIQNSTLVSARNEITNTRCPF